MSVTERRLVEASRRLQHHVDECRIPDPPSPAGDRSPRAGLVAAAGILLVVLVGVLAVLPGGDASNDPAATVPEQLGIVPLDRYETWIYDVTGREVDAGAGRIDVVPAESGVAVLADGRTRWPVALLEPWRPPSECLETESILLPSPAELAVPGEIVGGVVAVCDGADLSGAVRVTWGGRESVTVPAGSFQAARVDIDISGFVDPFPMTVTLWIDDVAGVVRQDVEGRSPGPERVSQGRLVDVS